MQSEIGTDATGFLLQALEYELVGSGVGGSCDAVAGEGGPAHDEQADGARRVGVGDRRDDWAAAPSAATQPQAASGMVRRSGWSVMGGCGAS
ncbi:hypothetical protein ACFVFS_39710 [Kitasatospora sp. NPDC057692]|uniref:hypothetical protein n=1 Tax=Kitasatospora sp. NPDC057692 TaxID=3346215 RepID=UPI0036C09ADC